MLRFVSNFLSRFKKDELHTHGLNDDEVIQERGSIPIFVPIIVTFVIVLPLVFLSTVGLKLSNNSLISQLKNNFGADVSFESAHFYLSPSPKVVIKNLVMYSRHEDGEFALKAATFTIKRSFISLFTFNTKKIDSLLLNDSIITINYDNDDMDSKKTLLHKMIDFLNFDIFFKGKNSHTTQIVNSSIKIAKQDGLKLDGFGIGDLTLAKMDGFKKINGSIFIDKNPFKISLAYNTDKSALSIDNPFDLNIESDVFTLVLKGKMLHEKSDTILHSTYNLNIKTLKGLVLSPANINPFIKSISAKIDKDITDISCNGDIHYSLKDGISKLSGNITNKSLSIGTLNFDNNNEMKKISFNIKKVQLSTASDSIETSQSVAKTLDGASVYRNIMSYDDNDMSFLKSKNVSDWISESETKINQNDASELENLKLEGGKKKTFAITDLMSLSPISIAIDIASLDNDKGKSIGSLNINFDLSKLGAKIKSLLSLDIANENADVNQLLKIELDGIMGDATQGGRSMIAANIQTNTPARVIDFIESGKSSDISNEFVKTLSKLLMLDISLQDKPAILSFNIISGGNISILDSFKLSLEDGKKVVEARMQKNISKQNASDVYKNLSVKLIGFDILSKLSHLNNFETFSQDSNLINKILLLKTISGKTDIAIECEQCNILSVPIANMRASISLNKDGIDISVPKIKSTGMDINGEAQIDISNGATNLNSKIVINELTIKNPPSFRPVFEDPSYKPIALPSFTDISGGFVIDSNIIDTPNYTFTKSTIKFSVKNGIVNFDDFAMHGYRKNKNADITGQSLIAQKLQDIQSKNLETDIKIEGSISMQSAPVYSLSFALNNISPSSILDLFSGNLGGIDGALSLSGRLSSSDYGFAGFIKNLEADAKLSAYNANITGFDINSVAIALGKRGVKKTIQRSKKNKALAEPIVNNVSDANLLINNGPRAVFNKMTADVIVKDQKVVVSNGVMDSGIVSGTFVLDGSLLSGIAYNVIGKLAFNGFNFKGGAPVPLNISFASSCKNLACSKDINLAQVESYLRTMAVYRRARHR